MICNLTWTQGILPEEWREAEIIQIHAQGKLKHDKASYRPISLLGCIGKTICEWSTTGVYHSGSNNCILNVSQSGYRKFRSLEDQTTYMAQADEGAFQRKQKVSIYLKLLTKSRKKDLSANSPNVALKKRCLSGSEVKRRCARVKASNTISDLVHLHEGVPQGGVLSCPQSFFWSILMIYLNYSVRTSTVPYTQMIWQYGLRRKPLVQHKPECRMPSAKWNSGLRTGVSPSMRVKQSQCFSLYQLSQSSLDFR